MVVSFCKDKCRSIPGSLTVISVGRNSVSPYILGYKGCVQCNRFFKTENKVCQCCSRSMRTPGPHHKKILRNHPELVAKLEGYVTENIELRRQRDIIEKQMRESVEHILQTKNEIEQAVADRELEAIMMEQEVTTRVLETEAGEEQEAIAEEVLIKINAGTMSR